MHDKIFIHLPRQGIPFCLRPLYLLDSRGIRRYSRDTFGTIEDRDIAQNSRCRLLMKELASYTSPDGKYELLFQQVGDPDWPFGHTHARLVLKDEAGTIAKYSFDIADDGANARSDLCQVTWKATQVEAVISGEEQNDNQYILFFNGKTDSNQLDKRFGKY